ncbi:MAG TPA: SGNH/GDSL hydrolase family protein [Sumerlaeia bacterium]|nr:SGNH/GDSL hydrolase family protein [Sumerlaeia bacterium]
MEAKPSPRSRLRSLFRYCAPRIALSVIPFVLAFSAGETFARYKCKAWPFERKMRMPDFLTGKDATLRWRFSWGEDRNRLGLRNREIGPKEPNTFRILFLGDSLVWTGETTWGPLYTQMIEGCLNEKLGATGRRIEVINAGVPGYTTYQELEFLKIYGLDMAPDVVILGFVLNDVYCKYLQKPTDERILDWDPSLRLCRFDTRSFPGILFARSYLSHEAAFALELLCKRVKRGHPAYPFEKRDDFFLAWKEYGWAPTGSLIAEMKGILRGRNIRMLAVVFPASDQMDDAYRDRDIRYVLYPQGRIAEIFNDNRIPFLDLTQAVYENGGLDLFQDCLHLSPKGNDVVTVEIVRFLMENQSNWFTR